MGIDRRVRQPIGKSLDARLLLGEFGRQRVLVGRGPRDVDAAGDQLVAPGLQPVAEPLVRNDVIAVVVLDPLQDVAPRSLALAELQPRLEGDDARARVAEVDLALEAVERLHLLDRVALDRRAQRLADGPQQVDEDAFAQESIDLGLPRAVAAHEALERRRLVGCVVVDVHGRVRGETSHEEVDQRSNARRSPSSENSPESSRDQMAWNAPSMSRTPKR